MPPATPHRFLSGRRRRASPSKEARSAPPASRRPERGDGFDDLTSKPAPSAAKQFAYTPPFSHGRVGTPSKAFHQASPSTPLLAEALRASIRRPEDVQEALEAEDEDDEMLEIQHETAIETTENAMEEQPWVDDLPHSPKRQKLDNPQNSNQTAFQSPAQRTFKHPTTPASHMTAGLHSFIRAPSVASTVADEGTAARRPAFLRSSIAPSESFEPLPEAFSPHRRGDKFVSGGMAATLQQWVVETGQAAAHGRRGQGYLRGEDFVHKIKVHGVAGGGSVVMVGTEVNGVAKNMLLVVDSKNEQSRVSVGSVVGIRAPVWDVDVGGRRWTVGVDWRLLS